MKTPLPRRDEARIERLQKATHAFCGYWHCGCIVVIAMDDGSPLDGSFTKCVRVERKPLAEARAEFCSHKHGCEWHPEGRHSKLGEEHHATRAIYRIGSERDGTAMNICEECAKQPRFKGWRKRKR